MEHHAFPTSRARLLRAAVAALLATASLVVPATLTARAAAPPTRPASVSGGGCTHSCLATDLRADLQKYLAAWGKSEHVSAAGLSVSLPGHRDTVDVSAGTRRFGGSQRVRPDDVWQIGSNTKAFTSVLLLQLEAERRLSVNDTLGKWLPQYPRWRGVTIKRLLNMTSGIPNYTDQTPLLAAYAAHPHHYFSAPELVSYAVPGRATTGYSYSNTNYVLAEMVIEKASGESYRHELYRRIIRPLHLHDLWYRTDVYPRDVTAREPAGYYFNRQPPALAKLVGQDVSRDTLSWARGAGGIISTTRDMTRWERALYDGRLLPAKQQAELLSLVSTRTGKPIKRTSASDPGGFGLGVAQATYPGFGTVWLYEGGTLGFRTLHVWFPDSGAIIAIGLNSAPGQDHVSQLAVAVHQTLVAHGLATPGQLPGGPALTPRAGPSLPQPGKAA